MGKNDEVETLDLFDESDDKKVNGTLEGVSEENIKDTILHEDLEKGTKHENFEQKIMAEDNSVDSTFGEEFVGLDNLDEEKEQETKKKKSSFPAIIILVVFVMIALLGFGFYKWNEANNETLKEAMKEPAIDYFDKYMSVGTGASAYTVTLKNLKEANSNNGENYKLDVFDKCDDSKTEAIININRMTNIAIIGIIFLFFLFLMFISISL